MNKISFFFFFHFLLVEHQINTNKKNLIVHAPGLVICPHLIIYSEDDSVLRFYFYFSVKFVSLYLAVPPETPICKLQGTAVVKANVTLTCLSSAGKPVPKYKWSKTSPTSEFFFSPTLSKFCLQIRASIFTITLITSGTDFVS